MDQHVRDANDSDLPAVAEIYAYETAHSYSTFETEERPVEAWAHKLHGSYPFLVADGFHTALALIALPNAPSVRLHERAGFALVGTLREVGDKQDRMIDVGVYQRML
jgi:L-amino acid N-acyltransferase YncA